MQQGSWKGESLEILVRRTDTSQSSRERDERLSRVGLPAKGGVRSMILDEGNRPRRLTGGRLYAGCLYGHAID
jgi:hypothetical protein